MCDSNEKEEDEVHSLQYKIILLGDGAVGKVIVFVCDSRIPPQPREMQKQYCFALCDKVIGEILSRT